MKKIVIAPDSFKESFSALQAAEAIERGFRAVFPETKYEKKSRWLMVAKELSNRSLLL